MATISNLGVGSGLDLSTLYDNLQTAEETKLTTITDQQTKYQSQLSAYGKIQSALTTLQTATTALATSTTWNSTSVSSTNTAFSATTTSEATVGSYTLNVQQLAKAQVLMSGAFTSNSTQLGETTGTTRTLTISQADTDTPLTVTLSDSDTSLQGIANAINNANGNVTATIVKASDSDYRLMLTSKSTGADSAMTVTVTGDDTLQAAIGYDSSTSTGALTQQTAAQDAIVSVNGISVQRDTNTIDDALPGVTLTLSAVSTSDETLTISRATDDNKTAITTWVNAYNSLQTTLASVTKYVAVDANSDSQSTDNGALVGDSNVRFIKSQLSGLLSTSQDGTYAIMAQLGITQDPTSGKLVIDDDKLTEALSDNPDAVSSYFIGDGETTGFATQLDTKLTNMLSTSTGSEGMIQTAQDGINAILDSLSDRYDAMQASIDATMERYKTQFTALDTLMSQLSATSSYLTSLFSSSSSTSSSSSS
ncbi:flagellar filament capping protein FliD [Mangrovibacter yixingensis]|uniref:flagellar filament capping protein FliD n=1 Tax=Mangrovibacter yixingensis TaxID=1529639 RepID=UPI001CFB205F|nr:flagellar filament capping protein FliD [Mangrovibacter yixingensis]